MAKVAEGGARVANEIGSGRQQRRRLAMGIKNATRRRCSEIRSLLDSLTASRLRATSEQATEAEAAMKARRREIHSLLKSWKVSRNKMGREQTADAKRATRTRHGDVHSLLQGLKAARVSAGREYRREAIFVIKERRSDLNALMAQFRRMRGARRQHRKALVMTQRDEAAAFMRDLTSSVAALRENFAKDGRDRVAAIRECLAAYASDRREAAAIGRGNGHRRRMAAAIEASPPSAAASPAIRTEPPAPPAHEITVAETSDAATRPGTRPFGNLGLKDSSEHHGGDLI